MIFNTITDEQLEAGLDIYESVIKELLEKWSHKNEKNYSKK